MRRLLFTYDKIGDMMIGDVFVADQEPSLNIDVSEYIVTDMRWDGEKFVDYEGQTHTPKPNTYIVVDRAIPVYQPPATLKNYTGYALLVAWKNCGTHKEKLIGTTYVNEGIYFWPEDFTRPWTGDFTVSGWLPVGDWACDPL